MYSAKEVIAMMSPLERAIRRVVREKGAIFAITYVVKNFDINFNFR